MPIKVLFDHNMPPAIAKALHALVKIDGHEVWALKDKFPPDIKDIELFNELGKERKWVVISKDKAQAKRLPERSALLRAGVLGIYLAPSVEKQPINQQAATILWHWKAIVAQRENNENGLFLLPVNKGAKFRSL
ncbi:MAG: hypothetical protein WD046_10295 [Paracoccaceae bacterium]|tara:strand:- start:237 stop:638 length:402 start_codon:yes stop_codon:yes gene_type:complete